MTYIVGFRIDGISSIISDIRMTINQGQDRSACVKTGILFPGCIYGLAGNLIQGFNFINNAKNALGGTDDPTQAWQMFENLCTWVDVSKEKSEYFELMLSSRATGTPEFYVFDPINRLTHYDNDWISIGSGQDILDQRIAANYAQKIMEVRQGIGLLKGTEVAYPYCLCLWLSEITLTFESSQLEAKGVGGIFNFVYQTSDYEDWQKPAVYVFSTLDIQANRVESYTYRVCRIQEGLCVQCSHPLIDGKNGLMLYDATNVLPQAEIPNIEQFETEAWRKVGEQPFAFFYGFGYAQPAFQYGSHCYIPLVPDDRNPPPINEQGEISSHFKELIVQHFNRLLGPSSPSKGLDIHYFTSESVE